MSVVGRDALYMLDLESDARDESSRCGRGRAGAYAPGWQDGKRAHLLHDASLALGEGDVTARLVLNELDLNLSALATGLIVIVVVVVGSTGTRALDATVLEGAIAVVEVVVGGRGVGLVLGLSDVGHDGG